MFRTAVPEDVTAAPISPGSLSKAIFQRHKAALDEARAQEQLAGEDATQRARKAVAWNAAFENMNLVSGIFAAAGRQASTESSKPAKPNVGETW
ncbi:hypothetical protein FRB97_001211 [Tulasnella sp. 331]|nr:hypothetical protein FRB97_001211 [Tulasnella sp. 331]